VCSLKYTHNILQEASDTNSDHSDSEEAELPVGESVEEPPREWLDVDEDGSESHSIFQIVESCLKDIRKLKMPPSRSIGMITKLTAVTQYVKIRERFRLQNKCTKPSLSASLAIAKRMGKADGVYFARQIRHNEIYLLRYGRLPPTKRGLKHGQYTLLDNESVLHSVRRYLAAQNLEPLPPVNSVATSTRLSSRSLLYLTKTAPSANAQQ
jgi:hypothetical protein